ncbi:unnamed protein product, partial [Mesorhabditis spiculigera]
MLSLLILLSQLLNAVFGLEIVYNPGEPGVAMSNPVLLQKLRALFKSDSLIKGGPIQAYLLPSTDAHQSEYLAPHDFRVKFLSNFSGSNAYVAVTEKEALLWTDGRYFVQANKQLSSDWKLMKQAQPDSITTEDWIVQNFNAGDRIGFDPSLHRYEAAASMIEKFAQNKITAVPIEQNLVDQFWDSRPPASDKKVIALNETEHGRPTTDKLRELRETLRKRKAQAIVLSELDDVVWLFNIRGADIPYNPLVYSVAFITMDQVHLFIDPKKTDDAVTAHLKEAGTELHPYEAATEYLRSWHEQHQGDVGYKVFIPSSTNYALGSLFGGKQNVTLGTSPVQITKAVKNKVELEGMRNAHIRDSAALIEFLFWLEGEMKADSKINELEAGKKVDHLRSLQPGFVDLSFDTISASGEHAALPHYKADEESGKQALDRQHVYLVDSGGHYRDGTTDVTRTVWYGSEVPAEFKTHNTLVLIGHIDNAAVNFPEGILGIRLDTLARAALWEKGLDFGHGTGHGVGHFLNVHEGPIGISYRTSNQDGQLKAGQILTIEPGYYLPGKYGIRIENCYELIKAPQEGFLEFKALTLAPIQKAIIDIPLLQQKHKDWLNAYHARVLDVVGPYLEKTGKRNELEWLKEQCTPL